MTITFHRLSTQDLQHIPDVVAFVQAYRQQMFCNCPPINPNPADLQNFADHYVHAPNGCFILAQDGQTLIGGIGYQPLQLYHADGTPRFDGLILPVGFCAHDAIEIVKLYVSPPYRSLGIGSALVQTLKEHARTQKIHYWYLHTHPCLDGHAEQFWQKQGFTTFQKDKDDWQTIHMYAID